MVSEANLRPWAKFFACLGLLVGVTGLGLVALGLFVARPIELADLIVAGIRFVVFVPLPLALAWLALRARSWSQIHWIMCGVLLCAAALSWTLNG